MTTIRAHVPVKTPAGLVVALPPDIKPPFWPVFDLAVPCPNDTDGDGDCWMCARNPNAHLHGRYRVLEVLHGIRRTNLYPEHADAFSLLGDRSHIVIDHADLPAAIPGGVALIVEEA